MIEKMSDMTAAELKIFLVVARKTYGYQKQADKISLSQFQKLTGLSKQGVLNGIKSGMDHGWLICENDKYIHVYWISKICDFWESGQQSRPSENETSQRNRPAMVNEVDQLAPKLVNEVDRQKKGIKEKFKEKYNNPVKRNKKQK